MIFVRSWIFFFKQMTAYEMRISDWSSDVCSSDLLAGTILSVEGTDELATLLAANDVLGGSFLSRLNYDLRETKGWAYGVQGIVNRVERSEERRVGKDVAVRVDLGRRRIIDKKTKRNIHTYHE